MMLIEGAILQNVTIQYSIGIGLLALNLYENSKIENSNFQYNTEHSLNGELYLQGGNAHIVMEDFSTCSITISDCQFLHGGIWNKITLVEHEEDRISLKQRSAGLTVSAGKANVTITSCRFHNNSAPIGANLVLGIFELSNITMNKCVYSKANSSRSKGAVYIAILDVLLREKKKRIHFADSVFTNNFGGAMKIEVFATYHSYHNYPVTITTVLQNLTFLNNFASSGAAFSIIFETPQLLHNTQGN